MNPYTVIYKQLLCLILVLTGCMSCSDDYFRDQSVVPGQKGVQISFSIVTPDPKEVVTETKSRSNYENYLEDVYLLVLDENYKYLECSQATSFTESDYMASLNPYDAICIIYVIANAPVVMSSKKSGWIPGITTLSSIKQDLLKSRLKEAEGCIVEMPQIAPLVSVLPIQIDKIDKSVVIPDIVMLERATAKIAIAVSGTDFSTEGANLYNAPVQGYVFPDMDYSSIPVLNYCGEDEYGNYSPDIMISGATSNDPLYCFETAENNNAYLIVKAQYKGVSGFYKVDMKDKADNKYLALKRNHSYLVRISNVQTYGYKTVEEAKTNTSLNDMSGVDIDVDVSDSYSHDIISNGSQYLGVSNSKLIICQSGSISGLVATVLNYTVPSDGWNPGSVQVVGSGLSLSSDMPVSLPLENMKNKEIKVNLTPESTGGSLIFRIGNMYKVVQIVRSNDLPSVPEEMIFENISLADKSNAAQTVKNKILFSTQEGVYSDSNDRLFSGGGKMFIKIEPNAGYGPQLEKRKGEFFMTHSNDEGKIKFIYTQEYLDVYTGMVQIKPYTYVGTFHRWDETAERIIRIKPVDADPAKHWSAIVVEGEDFIELDTDRSPDPGITLFPFGFDNNNPNNKDNALYKTSREIEDNCQFTTAQSGKSIVKGTGDLIYFRIGLKSKLPGGKGAKPRYGLVALVHSEGNHLIYVRQGEEPDYLMRNGDGRSRPDAVKISPFNLTIPHSANEQSWPPYYDVTKGYAEFTDYPSKGGYLFQGGDYCRAYNTYGNKNVVAWTLAPPSRANNNLCPWGRVPKDGLDGSDGQIDGSEIRQSFWLNPISGFGKSDYQNMLRGYIADGYFDRRRIRYPNYETSLNGIDRNDPDKDGINTYQGIYNNEQNPSYIKYPTPTIVDEVEGQDMAFAGMLLYNPYNFASVFIPATGSRNGQVDAGRLEGVGAESNFWTSTNVSGGVSYLATGYYNIYNPVNYTHTWMYVFDMWKSPRLNMGTFSIRCVAP